MTIQQAVKDTLAADPVIGLRDTGRTRLCVCCTTNSAFKGGYCYECAEHHEAEAKRLRDLLARALPYVQDGIYKHSYNIFPNPRLDEAQALFVAIEAEIGGDDD